MPSVYPTAFDHISDAPPSAAEDASTKLMRLADAVGTLQSTVGLAGSYNFNQQLPVSVVAASGAAQTIPSPLSANVNRVTLTANCTFTFPTPTAGQQFLLALVQDATGSRAPTWPSTASFPQGNLPPISSAAGATDLFLFVCQDGATWDGELLGNNFLYWGLPPSTSTFVQWGNTGSGSVASGSSFNLPSNVTSGNTVLLAVTYGGAPGTVTISGAGVTTWTRVERGGQNNAFGAIGYDLWIGYTSTGGSRAITVTDTGGFGYQAFAIEFANVLSVSQWVQETNVGVNEASCTLRAFNQGQTMVVFANAPGSTINSSPGAPWTAFGGWGNKNGDVAYTSSTGAGAYTATWGFSSTPYGVVGVVLHSQAPSGIGYVGTPYSGTANGASNTRTLAINAATIGDVIVFMTFDNDSNAQTVSSVSGGGVTTWHLMGNYQTPSGPTYTSTVSIWWGVVTSTGAQTITATFSGSANDYVTLFSREYSLPTGTTTWSMSGFAGTYATTSPATSLTLPTLTVPGTAKWALYVGVGGTTSASSFLQDAALPATCTLGYNYFEDVSGVGTMMEAATPSTGTPTPPTFGGTVGGSNGGQYVGAGSILTAS